MPALIPTDFVATVVWLGAVPDRAASLMSQPLGKMALTFAGYEAEDHAGLTRPSCSRVVQQYPRNTPIKNTRQISIVSKEQLDEVASAMGVSDLDPRSIGASVIVSGIPDFSRVPPSSRLVAEDSAGPGLVIDMENRPCHLPAPYIDQDHPGVGKSFKSAASGKRGVTAWVEKEGRLYIGQQLKLHIPDQPAWRAD